jgi:cytochrome P450
MRQSTRPATDPPRQLSELPSAPGGMPLIGHAWSLLRRPFAFLESLRALGGIVRMDIGKMPVYMLTRPELVHTILVTEARRVQRGGNFFDRIRADLVTGKGLGTFEGELHLRRRRLMQPALHRHHIGTYIGLMRDHTQALSDSWRDGQTIDVDHAVYELITENAAGCMFGMSVNPEMSRTVRRALPILTDNFMVRLKTPKSLDRFVPLPANRRFNQALRELRQTIDNIVTQRLDSPATGDDLLGMMLAATDPDTGQPIGLKEVCDELTLALFAGIFTTATTLSWVFYELDRFPEVQARVLDEIHTILDNGAPLGEALDQLDYTRRAIQEILRLHPVLMVIRRVTQPLELGGVALPAGTDLGYSPYTVHRDPDIYPDPTRLDPDRWLPERARSLPPGAFMAFGEGRHRCIGEFFAWAEILIAVMLLLPRWKLRLAPGQVVREVHGVHPRPNTLRMTINTR